MDKLVISSTGFPGTNKTWRFLQECFTKPLAALAMLTGDKTIMDGVTVSLDGTNISGGFICVAGEILPFQAGAYSTTVSIVEVVENVSYNIDLNNDQQLDSLPGYVTRYARPGTGGITTFPFTELQRLKSIEELSTWTLPADVVLDATYIKFTQTMLNKLNGIDEGAEVNVRSDWNDSSPGSDSHILNKPFTALKVTHGMMMASQLQGGNQSGNPAVNRATVYPPSGFNIGNLVGFINSLAFIHFGGNVDSNDRFWCKYQVDTPGNRVVMYGNASEYGSAPLMNYFAIWIK